MKSLTMEELSKVAFKYNQYAMSICDALEEIGKIIRENKDSYRLGNGGCFLLEPECGCPACGCPIKVHFKVSWNDTGWFQVATRERDIITDDPWNPWKKPAITWSVCCFDCGLSTPECYTVEAAIESYQKICRGYELCDGDNA